MMQRRFQDTLSHPKSLAKENHHQQQKNPPQTKIKIMFFFFLLLKNWKIKSWDCSLRPKWWNCPWEFVFHSEKEGAREGGRKWKKGKGPQNIFFSFLLFSPSKITAILGARGQNQTNRTHLDLGFLEGRSHLSEFRTAFKKMGSSSKKRRSLSLSDRVTKPIELKIKNKERRMPWCRWKMNN